MEEKRNGGMQMARNRKPVGKLSSAAVLVIAAIYYFLSENGTAPTTLSTTPGSMEVHYMDVDQGDATLLVCDGETLLIDAGENPYGEEVVDYLRSKGVEKLDYVIGTHPHSDHIGGLDTVIKNFDCETIFLTDYTQDTRTYQEVLEAVEDENCELMNPKVGDTYRLGSAEWIFIAPNREDYESMNDASIGLVIQNGEHRFFFAGDAEREAEPDILENGINIEADVYKVTHHGSRTSSMEELVEAIDPQYAVISCGEENEYGHPHAAPLNLLRSMGVQVFRTDEQGTIICTSDGETLKWNMSPSDSWKTGN